MLFRGNAGAGIVYWNFVTFYIPVGKFMFNYLYLYFHPLIHQVTVALSTNIGNRVFDIRTALYSDEFAQLPATSSA